MIRLIKVLFNSGKFSRSILYLSVEQTLKTPLHRATTDVLKFKELMHIECISSSEIVELFMCR